MVAGVSHCDISEVVLAAAELVPGVNVAFGFFKSRIPGFVAVFVLGLNKNMSYGNGVVMNVVFLNELNYVVAAGCLKNVFIAGNAGVVKEPFGVGAADVGIGAVSYLGEVCVVVFRDIGVHIVRSKNSFGFLFCRSHCFLVGLVLGGNTADVIVVVGHGVEGLFVLVVAGVNVLGGNLKSLSYAVGIGVGVEVTLVHLFVNFLVYAFSVAGNEEGSGIGSVVFSGSFNSRPLAVDIFVVLFAHLVAVCFSFIVKRGHGFKGLVGVLFKIISPGLVIGVFLVLEGLCGINDMGGVVAVGVVKTVVKLVIAVGIEPVVLGNGIFGIVYLNRFKSAIEEVGLKNRKHHAENDAEAKDYFYPKVSFLSFSSFFFLFIASRGGFILAGKKLFFFFAHNEPSLFISFAFAEKNFGTLNDNYIL